MEDTLAGALNASSTIALEASYETCPNPRIERRLRQLDFLQVSYECRTDFLKTAPNQACSVFELDF